MLYGPGEKPGNQCTHRGPRLRGRGSDGRDRTYCADCGEQLIAPDLDPKLLAFINLVYQDPPEMVAASFMVLRLENSLR